MNTWGNTLKISIFGESHGEGVGIVLDGIPAGIRLDMEELRREMKRRAPGRNTLSTPRSEADEVRILSGFFEGRTTGTPMAVVIENTNTISKHYDPSMPRPGHADFTGFARYGASHDYRGGGHFSGRLTAPLVFAGAVAKQVLRTMGVEVGAHILRLGPVWDQAFDPVKISAAQLREPGHRIFPTLDTEAGEAMSQVILEHRNAQNSIGGVIECGAVGMPVGVGSPFFGSVESRLSSMLFSVPAVKGVEFGDGFGFVELNGKTANDEFYWQDEKIKTYTNHNGGINGGITNGMPVIFRTVVKPTPSISLPQRTVNFETRENAEISVHGRHDPCVAYRAVAVVEAATAVVLLDLMLTDLPAALRNRRNGEEAERE